MSKVRIPAHTSARNYKYIDPSGVSQADLEVEVQPNKLYQQKPYKI
jgi:hypothetical protein